MTQQPEALRLADELRAAPERSRTSFEAAAELCRLHASCEDYAQHKQRQDQRVLELAERALELKAQRDALLEALNAMLTHMGMDEDEWNKPTFDQARAAIKAVEETK